MTDIILITGDKADFLPNFGAALAVPRPGVLQGSGPATFGGKRLCVDGDESRVSAAGVTYTTPQYSIPGVGTLRIDALVGDQKAKKTRAGGRAVLLVGSRFSARLEVQTPAQQPPPGSGSPIPDPNPHYPGQGSFLTANNKLRGT